MNSKHLENIINTITDLIFYKDLDLKYLGANEAFLNFVGVSKEDLVGKTDFDLFPYDAAKAINDLDKELLKTHKSVYFEEEVPNAEGKLLYLKTQKHILRDEDGEVYGMVGSVTDFTEQKRLEREVYSSHKKIKDSIQFASLIQKAIIPENNILEKYTKEYFIFWEPKDIVGGDIYFISEIETTNEMILMVIDGAGHGVPGAFVTMLVKAIENQIRAELLAKTLEASPAKILSYFNKQIKLMLNQDKKSKSNAGFDGGVLYFNKETKECKFAGAKTDLYLVKSQKLEVIEGDTKHVGFVRTNIDQKYKEHSFTLDKNTQLYISTDGLFDQKGENKKRFGIKRFEEFLLKNSNKPLNEQLKILQDELYHFKKLLPQTDDITVIGLKV